MKKNNDEVPPGRSKTRRASSADNNGSVSQDADTAQPGGTSPKLPITTTSAAAAAAAARIGEGSNYLVALAGMKALESHVQDPSKGKKWRDRVTSWEERAGLGLPSVKLALGFLDVLGVSRASVYKQLLESALRVLLDKIPHLPEERMLLLLNDSFRYATQPELKSVPLKIITSMSVVPDKVLEKIIELQAHQPSQFEELGLPYAIKRLAWEKNARLFVKIASPSMEKYIASEFSPKMVLASQQVRFYKHLDTIKRRKLMGPQRINALAECTGGRPVLIGFLCDEIANRFKQETSNSTAGLWAMLLTDVFVTARERSYGSIADQSLDRLCALASRLDLAVREDVFGDAAVRDVQRLFREATGIGEEQQEAARGTRRAAAAEKAKKDDDATKLQKTLKKAWAAISKMDTTALFKEPVTEAIAEGYHKIVKTPMDLGTILKKIKGGGYPSFGDFDRDLRLMWENCRIYNKRGKYYEDATRQENEWSRVAPSFEDALRNQEASTSAAASDKSTNQGHDHRKRKGSASSQDDGKGDPNGAAPLMAMAPATQLDGKGLGRRVGLAAILLSEPFAAKLMYRHASERVPEACRERGILPRDHPTFAPLLQLLELGNAAGAMFRAGSFGVRAVEERLTRSVLPCVVALHTRVEGSIGRRGGDEGRDPGGNNAGGAVNSSDGAGASGSDGFTSQAMDKEDAAVPQDWKTWYKEFPAVRRLTCTMLCRALVRGGDEAARVVLMPAARAAVRKMANEQWLWASLGELLVKSAVAIGKGEKGARILAPQTLTGVVGLFSRGLDSASTTDVVFSKALEVVVTLLPLTSSPDDTSNTAQEKPQPLPRAALEELVDKAASRALRPPSGNRPRSEEEETRVKAAFERVFGKSPPEWRSKLTEKKRPVFAVSGKGGAVEGRPPSKAARSVSIKGPKRKVGDVGGPGVEPGGGVGPTGSDPKRRRSRI